MSHVLTNIPLAFRRLRQAPIVASIQIASLGVSIGCTLAVFSILNQILLVPLPVRDPEQLVNLHAPGPKPGFQGCNVAGGCDEVFSYPMFRDLQREQTVFTALAAHRLFGTDVTYNGSTISGQGIQVSGTYFQGLGLVPALGSLLGPRVDEPLGGHPVVVLSHDYWQSELGASRDILGQALAINGHSLTIIGVAPRDFRGTTHGVRPLVFVPLSMSALWSGAVGAFEDRRSYWLYLFARLEPGVSLARARAAIEPLYRSILADVEAPLQDTMSEQRLAQFVSKPLLVTSGRRGQSRMDDIARTPLVFLLGVSLLVVLIACGNSANLMFGRLVDRAFEIALRRSLGASRWQVVVQFTTESLVLGLISAAAGIVVAELMLQAVATFLPTQFSETILWQVDFVTVQFGIALSLLSGVLFGGVPGFYSVREERIVLQQMNEVTPPNTPFVVGRSHLGFVAVQFGLAMTLITTAGILMRSVLENSRIDPNFQAENVVTFRVNPVRYGYDSEQTRVLVGRMRDGLAGMPGVSRATVAAVPIFARGSFRTGVVMAGQGSLAGSSRSVGFNVVDDDYFQTLRMSMLAGRGFRESDDSQAPLVAIVNETFVRTFRLGREVVGKRMRRGGVDVEADMEIVGVVRDAVNNEAEAQPFFYVPYGQVDGVGSFTFYARTSLAPGEVLRSVPEVIAGLDPRLRIGGVRTLVQELREAFVMLRVVAGLSWFLAGVAVLLASAGLYCVVSLIVARRTREFGLRMALGASGARVCGMVLGHVGRVVATGCCLGFGGSIAVDEGMQTVVEGTSSLPMDIVLAAGMGLGIVALVAGVVPAWRASRVNPMVAIRK